MMRRRAVVRSWGEGAMDRPAKGKECHEETRAPQRTALFDHKVGAGDAIAGARHEPCKRLTILAHEA